ncbi:O-antigen ligase family protein [Caloramator australicus]|uniref:O-antigen ligase-related domain-containing protein n=1 Tax=Caloramator australicus RC3 TaxID=857293 RepID=I7KW16_9CLOT|nr:hypothetical protein CAAU_2225 [Caloramator australicus RC3]
MFLLILSVLILTICSVTYFYLDTRFTSYLYNNLYGGDLVRLELAKQTFKLAKDSLFLGLGPGQTIINIGVNPHNIFLEIMAEYGVFFLMGVLLIYIKILMMYNSINEPFISSLILSFSISFLFLTVSSSSLTRIYPVWIVFGLLFSIGNIYSFKKKVNNQKKK